MKTLEKVAKNMATKTIFMEPTVPSTISDHR